MGLSKTTMAIFFDKRLQSSLQSDFEEKIFGKLTPDGMNIFSSLRSETCQKDVVLNTGSSILVYFVNRSALQNFVLNYNSCPQFVSVIQTQPGKLKCPDCETHMCEPVLTSVAHSICVFIEFSPELKCGWVVWEMNINVGQTKNKFKRMVGSVGFHEPIFVLACIYACKLMVS